MKISPVLFLLSFILIGVTACEEEKSHLPSKPMIDTHWIFSSVEGDTSGIGGVSPRPYLLIRPGEEGLRFQVFAGCNNMLGHLETDSVSTMKFSRIASTRKMCPEIQLEDKLSGILPEITGFTIEGAKLTLLRNEDEVATLKAGTHHRK